MLGKVSLRLNGIQQQRAEQRSTLPLLLIRLQPPDHSIVHIGSWTLPRATNESIVNSGDLRHSVAYPLKGLAPSFRQPDLVRVFAGDASDELQVVFRVDLRAPLAFVTSARMQLQPR